MSNIKILNRILDRGVFSSFEKRILELISANESDVDYLQEAHKDILLFFNSLQARDGVVYNRSHKKVVFLKDNVLKVDDTYLILAICCHYDVPLEIVRIWMVNWYIETWSVQGYEFNHIDYFMSRAI